MAKKEDIVESFKAKTDELFRKIDGFSAREIEERVFGFVKEKIADERISSDDISLGEMALVGSRCRGLEKEDSDIDIVLEFESDYWREDSLFDLLHEDGWVIAGHIVDINPIEEGKSGSIADYLNAAEQYLINKKLSLENAIARATEQKEVNCVADNPKNKDIEIGWIEI